MLYCLHNINIFFYGLIHYILLRYDYTFFFLLALTSSTVYNTTNI